MVNIPVAWMQLGIYVVVVVVVVVVQGFLAENFSCSVKMYICQGFCGGLVV